MNAALVMASFTRQKSWKPPYLDDDDGVCCCITGEMAWNGYIYILCYVTCKQPKYLNIYSRTYRNMKWSEDFEAIPKFQPYQCTVDRLNPATVDK